VYREYHKGGLNLIDLCTLSLKLVNQVFFISQYIDLNYLNIQRIDRHDIM